MNKKDATMILKQSRTRLGDLWNQFNLFRISVGSNTPKEEQLHEFLQLRSLNMEYSTMNAEGILMKR